MSKILITGPPRCGKSTLISKLIAHYEKLGKETRGFLTPETKQDGKRIGFDVLDIETNNKGILARTGNLKSQYNLGRYYVFLKFLESVISNLEVNKISLETIVIIDEIGKMELFSNQFKNWILRMFQSDLTIIATIGQKLHHPIKTQIQEIPNIILFEVSRESQDKMFEKIISLILLN